MIYLFSQRVMSFLRREHYILAKQVNIEFTMFTKKRDGRQEGVRRITGKECTKEIKSYILTEKNRY